MSANDSQGMLLSQVKESFSVNQLIRKSQTYEKELRFSLKYLLEWPQGSPAEAVSVETGRFKAIKYFLITNSYKVLWGQYLIYPGYLLQNIKETQNMKRLKEHLSEEMSQSRRRNQGRIHNQGDEGQEDDQNEEEAEEMESLEQLQTSRFLKIETDNLAKEEASERRATLKGNDGPRIGNKGAEERKKMYKQKFTTVFSRLSGLEFEREG